MKIRSTDTMSPATPLTPTERVAGRRFRDDRQAALLALHDTDPPDHVAPNFLSHWRHECPARNNVSSAIELKERYEYSPEYIVVAGPLGGPSRAYTPAELKDSASWAAIPADGTPPVRIPAQRFGFVYKEGRCKGKGCGQLARSRAGKVVDAYARPPIEGRVARSTA